jgi:hypothetical protein
VGILCPVVDALVLMVLDAGHSLPLGRGKAFQFVGDQQLAAQRLGFRRGGTGVGRYRIRYARVAARAFSAAWLD